MRPQTLRGRVTGVTIEGQLPVRFREPAAWLREFVVHTPDATLVAHKNEEESIRKVVERLKEMGWMDVL